MSFKQIWGIIFSLNRNYYSIFNKIEYTLKNAYSKYSYDYVEIPIGLNEDFQGNMCYIYLNNNLIFKFNMHKKRKKCPTKR
jgi:hypothetical protein